MKLYRFGILKCRYCGCSVDTDIEPAECGEAIIKGRHIVACLDCCKHMYKEAKSTGWDGKLIRDPISGTYFDNPNCKEYHVRYSNDGLDKCPVCGIIIKEAVNG